MRLRQKRITALARLPVSKTEINATMANTIGVTITGHSDDIISINGQVTEELYPPQKEVAGDGVYLSVSDGTLLRVRYDKDGIWRFTRLVGGLCTCTKEEGDVEKDTFDVIHLAGDVKWVLMGTALAN